MCITTLSIIMELQQQTKSAFTLSIHEHVPSVSMSIILKLYIGIDVRTCEVQDASKVQEGTQECHLFIDISRFCEEHFEHFET